MLSFLISKSVTLRRKISIFFNKISMVSFMYAILLVVLSFYFLSKYIDLHGGLLHITNLIQVSHILLFFAGILILQFASFNCKKTGIIINFFYKPISSLFYTKKNCSFILLLIISGAVLSISVNNLVLIFFMGILNNYGLYLLSIIYKNSELSTTRSIIYKNSELSTTRSLIYNNSELSTIASLIFFLLGSFSLCSISCSIYLLANPGDLYDGNYFNVILLLIFIPITQLSIMNFILSLNNKDKKVTFTEIYENIFIFSIATITLFFIKDFAINNIGYLSLLLIFIPEYCLNTYLNTVMYKLIDLLIGLFVIILFDYNKNKYIFLLKRLSYLVLIFSIKNYLGLFYCLLNSSVFSLEALKIYLIKEFWWYTDTINNYELETKNVKNHNSNYDSKQVVQYQGNTLKNSLATINTTNYLTNKLISSFRSINNNYISIKNTLYGFLKNNLELWLNIFNPKNSITTGFSSYFQPYTLPKVVTLQSKAEINLNLIVNSTILQKCIITNFINNNKTLIPNISIHTNMNRYELYNIPEIIKNSIIIELYNKIPDLLINISSVSKELLSIDINKVYNIPQKLGLSEIEICKKENKFVSTIENLFNNINLYNNYVDKGLNIELQSFLNILDGKKINNEIKVNMMHFNSGPNENQYIGNQLNLNNSYNQVIQQSSNINAVDITYDSTTHDPIINQRWCGSLLDFINLNYNNLAPDFLNTLRNSDLTHKVNMNQCLFLYWLNNIEKAKLNVNNDSLVCFYKSYTARGDLHLRVVPYKYIVYNNREDLSIYKEIGRFSHINHLRDKIDELNMELNNEIVEPKIHWIYGYLSVKNNTAGSLINPGTERNWILYEFIRDETILSYQNLYNWCKSNIYVNSPSGAVEAYPKEYDPKNYTRGDVNIIFKDMYEEYYNLPLKTPPYVGVSRAGTAEHENLYNCENTEKIKFYLLLN